MKSLYNCQDFLGPRVQRVQKLFSQEISTDHLTSQIYLKFYINFKSKNFQTGQVTENSKSNEIYNKYYIKTTIIK